MRLSDYLAVEYLINQNMLDPNEEITGIDYEEIETVVVRTEAQTDFEDKLKKKTSRPVVRKGQYS